MRDREVAMAGLRDPDVQQFAVLAKDLTDVGGKVAEEVTDVRVPPDASAREPRAKPVYCPTAVCVGKTTDQRAGVSPRQRELPIRQLDRPQEGEPPRSNAAICSR